MTYDKHVFTFYSEMQEFQRSFDRMQINVEDVKQFFLLRSMTESLRDEFIKITGKYRPTMDDLDKVKYDVAERYKDKQQKYKNKRAQSQVVTKTKIEKDSTGMAVNLDKHRSDSSNKANIWCNLCKGLKGVNNEHSMSRCERFKVTSEKLDRLKTIKACRKCGFDNHVDNDCKFKFKSPCKHCGELHFSFLCPNGASANIASSEDAVDSESELSATDLETESVCEAANICCTQVYQTSDLNGSILPTFVAKIAGHTVRCLFDSGCQHNFINKRLVEQAKLKFIRDINITINGFNASHQYRTRIVVMPMQLGNITYELEAIVLPNIPAKFSASNLSRIAQAFEQKGYSLANPLLVKGKDEVNKLDIMLGSDASYCFRGNTKVFGKKLDSAYLDTVAGIMLTGNSDRMLTNLSDLRDLNNTNTKTEAISKSSKVRFEYGRSLVCTQPISAFNCNYEFGHFKDNSSPTSSELNNLVDCTLNYDKEQYSEECTEINKRLIDYEIATM